MEPMMEALKVTLSTCGIGEHAAQEDGNHRDKEQAEAALSFLESMGVPYFVRMRTVQV